MSVIAQNITVKDALVSLLQGASRHNHNDMVAPVAVLWTDENSVWAPVIAALRASLPILTLGDYQPDRLTGPAIWLRCVIDGTLSEISLPQGVPILYLPGVSRSNLRAVESCPKKLRPLAELQYRGVFFTQASHRDWTPAALLAQSKIKVAEDQATKAALGRVLPRLLLEPLGNLAPISPLNADTLNGLLTPDPQQLLLRWLDDPKGTRAQLEAAQEGGWASFRELAKTRYGFDPVTDGELSAARYLAQPPSGKAPAWKLVWARFAEVPTLYPQLPDLLRRAKPDQGLFDASAVWPQDNEAAETRLRADLSKFQTLPFAEASAALKVLEAEHGPRRAWVWAKLGDAPLAEALKTLVTLAEAVTRPLGTGTPQTLAERYVAGAWEIDAQALEVMAAGRSAADSTALHAALRPLYRPWLEAAATEFQRAVLATGLPAPAPDPEAHPGQCWLFSDGLRFDLAKTLSVRLQNMGLNAELNWQFSALPGVTSTAKPAVSPVAAELSAASEFGVSYRGSKVTAEVLRRALREAGFETLQGSDLGDGSAAWTEYGNFDSLGHSQGWRLTQHLAQEIGLLAERIGALLGSGFTEVRVVTDHGWLLLPGGLDKLELPQHLTDARKGRCARLKPGATTDQPTVPWRFDPEVQIAVAPGLGVYLSGQDYEHGGLSLQECVLPVLKVTKAVSAAQAELVLKVRWAGLRCRLDVTQAPAGAVADLRIRAADATSSVAQAAKPIDAQGKASLVVPDETREGDAVHVVILSQGGQLLAQQTTTVGD